jgi:hypothetical protein
MRDVGYVLVILTYLVISGNALYVLFDVLHNYYE